MSEKLKEKTEGRKNEREREKTEGDEATKRSAMAGSCNHMLFSSPREKCIIPSVVCLRTRENARNKKKGIFRNNDTIARGRSEGNLSLVY